MFKTGKATKRSAWAWSAAVSRALVQGCERWLLRRFDHVSSISRAMVPRAVAKGVAPERTSLVPNWANVRGAWPAGKPTPYRAQLGLPSGAVVALYSGTMGVKHDHLVADAVLAQLEAQLRAVAGARVAAAAAENLAD